METGIVILAAGNSSRLGQPKQLLEFKGESLLEITIKAAIEASLSPIVVVLGAYAEMIGQEHTEVSYIINENWEMGMSLSIGVGLTKLLIENPTIEKVIIAVSDQPFIDTAVFKALVAENLATGKNVASQYAQTMGVPALFNKKYFNQLKSLDGSSGAKDMLRRYKDDTSNIIFELGYIDIDTETDYKKLKGQQ